MTRKTNAFARRFQSARELRELNRALRNASPSMQQELTAAAARQGSRVSHL